MAEVRCSVCGVTTSQTESCSFTLSPGGDGTDEAHTHIVCSACSSRLSAEIAKGHTTMMQPPGAESSGEPRRTAVSNSEEPSKAPSDAVTFIESAEVPGSKKALAIESRPFSKRNSAAVEFEFAKKRQFASYELLGEISRGSFGVVYKARQAGLDRIVALKVLLDGVHASSEAVERFNREAKSVARLKHPNVVPIYDIGACDGHHYFAMAFIEGYPLSTHILARTLTISDALSIAESIADAIECAHRAGVIHRDIKPSNILIDKNGVPHITDFGLAKQVDLENKYTMSGTTLGTPAYMPPEQARGQLDQIDARSDVYALGTVLYEMLTGVTPFSGRSLLEVVVAVINEPVPPPRHLNPKIHRDVQTIVLKCLEKEREQRYASAADLRDDLRRFRSGEAIVARPTGMLSRLGRKLKRNKLYAGAAAMLFFAFLITMKLVADTKKKDLDLAAEKAKRQVMESELKEKEQVKYKTEWEWVKDSKDPRLNSAPPLPPGARPAKLYAPEGHVPMPAIVSPENFFGDYRATLVFTLDSAQSAAQGITVGIQSVNSTYEGIPYVVEFKEGRAHLWAPTDLESFSRKNNSDAPLPLEIKIDKEAPTLVAGRYRLNIERLGTRFKISLSDEAHSSGSFVGPLKAMWGPVSLEIQDYNLSNWAMKYTQLVVRKPSPGFDIRSGKVERKFGGQTGLEASAINNFNTGEYTAASSDFRALIKEAEKADFALSKPEDKLNVATALFQLNLIEEIDIAGTPALEQPDKWRRSKIFERYAKAKLILYELIASRNSPVGPQAIELLREVRVRLAVCWARRNDADVTPFQRWRAIDDEITQGWMNGKVGETLGWELQSVLELAHREERKDIVLQPALDILMRCGLDPVSTRVSLRAHEFGKALVDAAEHEQADQKKARYDQLRELYNAVPTPALYSDFAAAAAHNRTVLPEEAVKLLTYLPLDSTTGPQSGELVNRAMEQFKILVERSRWDLAQTLLTRYAARPQVFVSFFDALTTEAPPMEMLSVIIGAVPADIAVRVALDGAALRIAAAMVKAGRYTDLIALHGALRQGRDTDTRLAQQFSDSVKALSDKTDLDSEFLALNLLRYGSRRVSPKDPELLKAARELAERKAESGAEGAFDSILRIKEACPAAHLVPAARIALSKVCEAGKYKVVVDDFIQARPRFLNDGARLLPELIVALENTAEQDSRDQRLEKIWSEVRDELRRTYDETALRQWQLEFGDVLLALARRTSPVDYWEGARKNYRDVLNSTLLAAAPTGADLSAGARAALRLIVLDIARRDDVEDPVLEAINAAGAPEDIKLAAQVLATPSPIQLKDLKEKRDAIQQHVLTDPEWTLIVALREKQDGDDVKSLEDLRKAIGEAQAPRPDQKDDTQAAGPGLDESKVQERAGVPWVAAVASELRARRTAERDPSTPAPAKPEGDELTR